MYCAIYLRHSSVSHSMCAAVLHNTLTQQDHIMAQTDRADGHELLQAYLELLSAAHARDGTEVRAQAYDNARQSFERILEYVYPPFELALHGYTSAAQCATYVNHDDVIDKLPDYLPKRPS